MTSEPGVFRTAFKPVFDEIVAQGPSVGDAVSRVLAFEAEVALTTPKLYGSTAITSAGFKRDTQLEFREVVRLNNEVAARIATQLHADRAPGLSPESIMLPTELGKVPGWADSHYLVFYFCWLAGLDEGHGFCGGPIGRPGPCADRRRG